MTTGAGTAGGERGNYIAEYYGHEVYPTVSIGERAFQDQVHERCPFLTLALTDDRACVKADASRGVCVVSTVVDGQRADWLVCPHRALDPKFMGNAARRLFGYLDDEALHFIAAPTLTNAQVRADVRTAVLAGEKVLIYFQEKLGGELSISKTDASPELAFDWTLVEIAALEPLTIGRFGILEIQTMDFHGSYKHAVGMVRLQREETGGTADSFATWLTTDDGRDALSRKMEGPNLSNVFKRTFYQMAYKFQLGGHRECAGTGFAIPEPVWRSWRRHLGDPALIDNGDGTFSLPTTVADQAPDTSNAWLFVFRLGESSHDRPRSIESHLTIRIDVQRLIDLVLQVSPAAAMDEGGPVDGVTAKARKRIAKLWPEAMTVAASVPE